MKPHTLLRARIRATTADRLARRARQAMLSRAEIVRRALITFLGIDDVFEQCHPYYPNGREITAQQIRRRKTL